MRVELRFYQVKWSHVSLGYGLERLNHVVHGSHASRGYMDDEERPRPRPGRAEGKRNQARTLMHFDQIVWKDQIGLLTRPKLSVPTTPSL